jgi:hypothetical protein
MGIRDLMESLWCSQRFPSDLNNHVRWLRFTGEDADRLCNKDGTDGVLIASDFKHVEWLQRVTVPKSAALGWLKKLSQNPAGGFTLRDPEVPRE